MGHPNDRAALEAGSFVWALELDPHLWDVGQGNLNFSSVYLSVTVLAAVIAYVLILSTTTTKWEPSAAGRYPGLPSAREVSRFALCVRCVEGFVWRHRRGVDPSINLAGVYG